MAKKINLAALKPQTREVYEALKERERGMSAFQAYSVLGVENLSARVSELRNAGIGVETVKMSTRPGSRYCLVN